LGQQPGQQAGDFVSSSAGYTPLVQLVGEISKSFNAGATVSALAMIFIGLDTMALLACPLGQSSQKRSDFIAWVDKYLKADRESEYQYEGIDLYAARCAALHTYGSISDLHRGSNPPRTFGYIDNGPHLHDVANRFVLISIAMLAHDFSKAGQQFFADLASDPDLKSRIDSRIGALFLNRQLPG
jgi:hypothetical protein